jgi:type I restriction enzyme, S subunit
VTTTWPEAPLGEVAAFVRGITFKPADVVPLRTPGSIACMRTANVQAELDLEDVWAVPEQFCRRDDQRLRRGDLLVSTANSWNLVGKCAWVGDLPWSSTFGGFVSALRPTSPDLDPRYLYRWFASPRIQATLRSYGRRTTSISNLSIDRCRAMRVPLPPIEEQRRIAAVLDKAHDLRAKRENTDALLDALRDSIFLEMFGDPARNPHGFPVRQLRDLAVKFSDGPFGSNLKSSHYVENGVRVVRLQNIGVGQFVDHDRAYISETHFERLRKHECLPGDVLVGTLGDPNLRACVQPAWLTCALNKADCVQVRVNQDEATASWLAALLNQPATERMAQGLVLGQTRARISMGRLRSLHVPVPPLALQLRFDQAVESVNREGEILDHSARVLTDLVSSLQYRTFAGQL